MTHKNAIRDSVALVRNCREPAMFELLIQSMGDEEKSEALYAVSFAAYYYLQELTKDRGIDLDDFLNISLQVIDAA